MTILDKARIGSLAVARLLDICVPTIVDSWRNKVDMAECDARLDRWSRGLLNDVKVDLTVVGRENLPDPSTPFMVMSNHQSHYDIPVLFQSIPGRMRMVTKIEIYRIPIWGQALRASGFISVDRANRESAIKSLGEARARMNEGVIVWIAPEGTRSRDGTLGPFKKGGFVLALETGVPILPVTVSGTRHILPADTADVQQGVKVTVTIHPTIDPKVVTDRDELIGRVRDAIASALPVGPTPQPPLPNGERGS